jgi:hypothetical protein
MIVLIEYDFTYCNSLKCLELFILYRFSFKLITSIMHISIDELLSIKCPFFLHNYYINQPHLKPHGKE